MKRIATMVFAIIIATASTAFANNTDKPNHQTQNYEQNFSSLQVEDGIDLMLVESTDKLIEFEGADAAIAQVEWKIKDGVLHIGSKKGSLKDKVKLIVNVNRLNEIAIQGNSTVRSYGSLNSSALTIKVDHGSFVAVVNTGSINIVHADDIELEVTKAFGNVKLG